MVGRGSREVDLSSPSRHPEIDYATLEPLPRTVGAFESVHTINRYAKRFEEQADTAYRTGEGARARVFALRKRALYRTKTVALHRLVRTDPTTVRIVRHELNGENEMYCLYFSVDRNGDRDETYSFHQPLDAVEPELLEDVTGSDDRSTVPMETISFEASTETSGLEQPLPDAISFLQNHDLDPDDYLDARLVEDYEWGITHPTTFEGVDPDF